MEQRSLEKALKLIGYLSGNNGYTVSQLASFLMTTKRTIYRYFDTLRECGYVLIKNRASVYYISEAKENLPNYIRLVMLSEEEACMLNRLLDMLADTNPLKSELRRKLSALSEMGHWEDYAVSQEHARNIEILGYAIRMKQKVVLRGYGSSHSGTIRDRVVEPYRILEDGAYITAYDCHSSSCRVFKVARMKSVDLTGSQWESEHLHEDMFIDVFRMSGVPRYSVTILLTLRARNLMIEEFPLSRKHIRWYAKRMWRFHAQVCALEGIGDASPNADDAWAAHSRSNPRRKPPPHVPNRRPRFPTSTPPPGPSAHPSGFSIRSQRDSIGFNPTAHQRLPFVPPSPRSSIPGSSDIIP